MIIFERDLVWISDGLQRIDFERAVRQLVRAGEEIRLVFERHGDGAGNRILDILGQLGVARRRCRLSHAFAAVEECPEETRRDALFHAHPDLSDGACIDLGASSIVKTIVAILLT